MNGNGYERNNLRHYPFYEKYYVGIRYNGGKGKRVFSIPGLKFIKVINDTVNEYKLCRTYTEKRGNRQWTIYEDILDNLELNNINYIFEDIKEFTEVFPHSELAKYSYILTDALIRERLESLNEDIFMRI